GQKNRVASAHAELARRQPDSRRQGRQRQRKQARRRATPVSRTNWDPRPAMKKKAATEEPPKITAEDKARILAQLQTLQPAAPKEREAPAVPLTLRQQIEALLPAANHFKALSPAAERAARFEQFISPRLAEFGFEPRYRVDGLLKGRDERCGFQRKALAG